MEEQVIYFFDSYAIIEILKENPNYEPYKDKIVTITLFNLAEIYYHILDKVDIEKADEVYNKYKESVVEIDDETLKEAIKFRKEHKKQDLSYTDSIGYIYAKRNSMKFLTGDKEFQALDNVEFIK